ncbi:MAG: DNA ligase, partial [Dermatophilaceae bacterium]
GLAGAAGTLVRDRLAGGERSSSPFSDAVPRIDAAGATWVEPELVIEVRALELTGQHRLRAPSFLGIRHDLTSAELTGEADDGA